MKDFFILSSSVEQTISLAKNLARQLKGGDIIYLVGELGAGKTTFTKGLAQGLHLKGAVVNSPTFIFMNYYKGKCPIYHFDFYRIQKSAELDTIDLEDYFYGDGVCVIEWPQRLQDAAPKEFFQVTLEHKSEDARKISFSARGSKYEERLVKIKEKLFREKSEE